MVTPPAVTPVENSQHLNTKVSQEDGDLESRKLIWNLEQALVASRVQVYDDPLADTTAIEDNPLFRLVREDEASTSSGFYYGGVDVSFPPNNQDLTADSQDESVAVYVIIDRRTMKVVYRDQVFFSLDIPYIPTYLAFREIAPLEALVRRQVQEHSELTPRAILVDGNGILHPRHAGIACFLGTRTNIPTIGIGKTLFYEGGWTREVVETMIDDFLQSLLGSKALGGSESLTIDPALHRGLIVKNSCDHPISSATHNREDKNSFDRVSVLRHLASLCNGVALPLRNHPDSSDARFPVLGCALVGHGGKHSKSGGTRKPIFVSVGHRVSLQEAAQITASLSMARIPEPVRQADLYGRELMRNKYGG